MSSLADVNIRHMKLSSGDEIIALVQSINKEGVVIVERPLLIQSFTNPRDGSEKYYFMDYMPVSKKNLIHISINSVIAHCEVLDNVKEAYIKYCVNHTMNASVAESSDEPFDEVLEEVMMMDKSKLH